MRIAVILSSLLAVSSVALAEEPKSLPTLDEVLAAPAELHFDKAKIADVATSLSHRHGIEVIANEKLLNDAGLNDETFSGRVKADTLAEALSALLRPHHLNWTIEDDAVVVFPKEQDANFRITRIYRAADAKSAQRIAGELPKQYEPATWTSKDNQPYAHAYGRAVIVYHHAQAQVAIHKKLAGELTLAKSDGSSVLPAKLCQRRDIEFVDAKLNDVTAWLEKETGLKVRIKERSLMDNNLDPPLRITARAKNRPLASALTAVLGEYKLQWFVKDNVLTVASNEDSLEVHAVHDIGGLVLDDDYDALQDFITTNVTFWREQSGPTPIHFAVPHHVVVEADYQEQIQLAKKLEALRWALRVE